MTSKLNVPTGPEKTNTRFVQPVTKLDFDWLMRVHKIFAFYPLMMTIAIPLLETENSIGAVGPLEILTKTCVLWRQINESKSDGPPFDVQVVAEKRKPMRFANGITLRPS